jgi:GT2 family glycosyltransferase/glycosyltransferase involved in cell wall biosynthesis/SAM-dependent methyltransferase
VKNNTAYIFDQQLRVWKKPETSSISYSDGDEVENRIYQIIKNTQDVSTGSPELIANISDWATEYHFTPARQNLLRPFDFSKEKTILELGSGCGAITRQLAESGAKVTAVEGSLRRASITAERCRDLPNVSVYCENLVAFETEEKFDYVTLIGVMEYSRAFISGDNPELECLKKALSHLKEGGQLILAIENQLGLKYFNGAGEDHVGVPFFGINNLYEKNTVVTFGKKELSNLLTKAGFEKIEFYYPFPDYKIPNLILSEEGLQSPALNVGNLLSTSFSRDYTGNDIRSFNERLAWRVLARNQLIGDLSNSFLIFASPKIQSLQPQNWLSKYYNTSRPKNLMKESTICSINNELVVEQKLLYPNLERKEKGEFLLHIPRETPYIQGNLYLTRLLELTTRGCTMADIAKWIKPWLDFLVSHATDGSESKPILDLKLPGNYIDCVPHNLIEDLSGHLRFFDDEWVYKNDIPLSWVLLRGLYLSLINVMYTDLVREKTYYALINEVLHHLGLAYTQVSLQEASKWENSLKKFIYGKPRAASIDFAQQLNQVGAGYRPANNVIDNLATTCRKQQKKINLYEPKTTRQVMRSLIYFGNHRLQLLQKSAFDLAKKAYHKIPLPRRIRSKLRNLFLRYQTIKETKIDTTFQLESLPTLSQATQPDVYIWGVIDWHFRFQRPQHIAKNFANAGHRVFYFSNHFAYNTEPGFKVEKIYDHLPLYSITLNISEPLSIYEKPATPHIIEQIKKDIQLFLEWTQSPHTYSILQHPFWYDIAKEMPNQTLAYDCMDHHGGFEDNTKEILALENQLIQQADILIVTSQWLKDTLISKNPRLALIRNACDYQYFATPPQTIFQDQQKRKIIGYYGAIASWFDIELVEKMALAFPDCLILLIGEDSANVKRQLKKYSNILMIGEVKYQQLPHYLYAFDVCTIPFKIIPLTLATNPVKAYEYLSAGKPVVSTDLPELHQFENLVALGKSPEHFVQLVAEALATPLTEEEKLQRQTFASHQTWTDRTHTIAKAIEKQAYPFVSIIVLTYNNLTLTKACLDSIEKYTDYPNYEVIIVDNASRDETPTYLKQYCETHPRCRVILNESNVGFAAGNNQGLQAAQGDYLVILNNDTYVTPGWLSTLIRHFKKNPNLGLLGPVTSNIGNEAKINIHYQNMEEMIKASKEWTLAHMGETYPLSTAAFFCVMISKEVYQRVGGLDEAFGLGMFEDDDYCRRVQQQGYEIACADDVFIHHHLSASFDKLGAQKKQALFEKNKAIYEKKWGKWKPHQYR